MGKLKNLVHGTLRLFLRMVNANHTHAHTHMLDYIVAVHNAENLTIQFDFVSWAHDSIQNIHCVLFSISLVGNAALRYS